VTGGSRAVFLDRDGVLVRAPVVDGRPRSVHRVEELELEDGALAACSSLRDAGFLLVVVTNQPDIARGTLTREAVDEMHAILAEQLPLNEIRVCPHDDADDCACRKPRPGMLLAAAKEHGIVLERSFMVGDRWRDIGAGRSAGCACVFLDREYSESMPAPPDVAVGDLGEAVAWILARSGQ
jgi:D-glycero-D-manno-heptose 1,7-bisphosphate phosphatase